MYAISKRLFIVVLILLVGSSAVGSYFWYQSSVTKLRLANVETRLDNTEAQLNDTRILLDTTEVQLNDTKTLLDTTEAQLDVANTQLTMTEAQLWQAENENEQMLSQYASLKGKINVRLGLTPQDKQSFITSSNSLVSAKVLEVTGGYSGSVNDYWRDCERLYRWVVDNITYSHDSYLPILPESISGRLIWGQEYWRMPKETLEDKTGDCEDMALLLASMLRNYGEGKYSIWVLSIRSEESGHMAVAFPVESGRLTILDPAGNYYTGQYGSLDSSSISIAVKNWLSHWQREMPGAEIVEVFSGDVYEEFNNTAGFITWARE